MITLRRAAQRHHDSSRKKEIWLTFDPQDRNDPLADGFGALEILDEERLSPGAALPRRRIATPRSSPTCERARSRTTIPVGARA